MGWKDTGYGRKNGESIMRLKSLSIFLYLRGNFKKFIPQILVVALGVFLMYFVCINGGGMETQMKNNVLEPYKKLSFIRMNPSAVNEQEYINKLKDNKDVDRIIYSKRDLNIRADMLISSNGSPGLFISEDDTRYLMKKFDFKLVSGRIPQENNELLISSNYAKSRKIKVGSCIDENTDKSFIGIYKVAGIYDGKSVIAFGHIKNASEVKNNENTIVVVPKEGKLNKINDYINSLKNKQIDIQDYNSVNYEVEGFFPMFNMFAFIILAILIVVLTFTIGNMNYIHFFDRVGEFSILDALGYTKLDIFLKLAKEMCIVIVLGFGVGMILSFMGGNIFNGVYCIPKGVPVEIYNKWYVILSSIVPVAVGLFSSIPSIKFLSKMSTVDVLEGRNP